MRAVIRGVGHAVPPKVMTNHDLEKIVDTSDEWIVQRTGIKERRISEPHETSSTLGTTAALEALEMAGIDPMDIDLIACGTVTGDMIFPSTSCLIQENIGAKNAGAYDIGAACAGFIYSLATVTGMIESGSVKRALVVGVDVLSKYVDWTDRSTCVLFGDGGGAVVLEGQANTDHGVIKTVLLSDGSGAKSITYEAGGSLYPVGKDYSKQAREAIYMAGAEVYRFAVHAMGDACCRALHEAGLEPGDIDLFVPHQANLRIIDSAASRLNLPDEKVFVNVHKYGNTSGGSIPLGLYEAHQEGRLKSGMVVMTVGFGAGLVWGANIIRW
ncbi:MAG: ketoacyl-ACP synthase III [Fimbriimonadaceae bacterium]|nr:ketoacyl-ACP synthase III [Fimbriimonadaceae bacterium]